MGRNWYETYRKAVTRLTEAGVTEAELDAWYLLEHVSGMSRTDYLMRRMEEFRPEQQEQILRYEHLIEERAKRIPLSYLTGWRNFCGLDFAVNEAVLIPRQDTECLVEELLPYTKGKRVLDMCTGSGCIAISLAVLGHAEMITGVDISEKALAVARGNGERLLADRAESVKQQWIQSDLFEKVEGTYDIIVSNPPYIQSKVIETLEPEVRDYEPRLALDGTEDGLLFYRKITAQAAEYLSPDGLLAFEIGYDQGADVAALMTEQGYREVRVVRDLAGMDRIVMGHR